MAFGAGCLKSAECGFIGWENIHRDGLVAHFSTREILVDIQDVSALPAGFLHGACRGRKALPKSILVLDCEKLHQS